MQIRIALSPFFGQLDIYFPDDMAFNNMLFVRGWIWKRKDSTRGQMASQLCHIQCSLVYTTVKQIVIRIHSTPENQWGTLQIPLYEDFYALWKKHTILLLNLPYMF